MTYTADGLEHNEGRRRAARRATTGCNSPKRERKLALHDYGAAWADIEGDGGPR